MAESYPPTTEPFVPGPPLKSTTKSREIAFDADTDDLDVELSLPSIHEPEVPAKRANLTEESEEGPLLEGLISDGLRRGSIEELDEERHPWLKKGGGLGAGIARLDVSSILGAGIVGLPFALVQSGFVSGLVLLAVLGVVTDWTIRLIVINGKLSSQTTYIDIMQAAFGPAGRSACSFFQFTFAFGGMCAFCIILGDTLPAVLRALLPSSWADTSFFSAVLSRQAVVIFFTMSISYPLSLYRDIENLSKASGLALISMTIILLVVAIRGPGLDDSYKGPSEDMWTVIRPGIPSAIGVISFAYVCHHNSLLIYGSLAQPTLDRFDRLVHISTSFSVVASLAMAICGYSVFTTKTQGNILNNFPHDDLWANIARLCFGANMFATLPLECFVCREVFETFFYPGAPFNQKRHFVFTTALVAVSMAISLLTSDLGAVLEVAGGCGAAFLAYVFPAATYLKLATDLPAGKKWSARICVVFGIGVALLVALRTLMRASTTTDSESLRL